MFVKKLKPKHILIFILAITTVLRLFRLDYPNKYVFDEVYHGFTAKEYLKGNKEAWEWWTKPPPGVAYEWTHPPLAKEIMTASMFITRSTDAWAWRLPGVLLGVLSIYLVYLLGLKLLNNQTASLIAAFAFSIDGLNFVQSRTGMNDVYFVTFVLASLLFFLKKSFIISTILLGLAISSKWAALYIFLIYIPILLAEKRVRVLLYFSTIPVLVYMLTFIPFFLHDHNLNQFVELQQQMWWYHTSLKASHDYASPWWSWPLNLYPVWYFVDYSGDKIANIFASGNPVVFWVGSASILLTLIETLKRKSVNLFFILLGFFVFWLPWAASPRIMFLYHFSPSVPFLALSLGYQLDSWLRDKHRRKLVFVLLSLMLISFLILYPFLTGIPMPKNLLNIFFLTNITKNPF